jgi:peptidoglycan/xylan/chitin deacetylase (PgdA/CDA1 family)
MTWAALAEAVSTGLVTIGSHTHTHAVMDKLDPASVEEEMQISCRLIEEHTGQPVEHFAYPKGVFGGEATEAIVGRHVRSAALAEGGANHYGVTNPLRLDRSPIQTTDGMRYFEAKVRGGLRLEGALRSQLNGRRYVTAYN